jgi:hypothetical protein
MTAAAMTGPAPGRLVRLVPAAATAPAGFFLVSRSRASMRRRSPGKAAASSQRAVSTAPSGLSAFRTRPARAVVIALGTPPGISPPGTA